MMNEQQNTNNSNPWQWWENALKGVFGEITADEPKTGFYRSKRTNKQTGEITHQAVAYWYEDGGALRCQFDGVDVDAVVACTAWPFVSRRPITYEVFKCVREGGAWPDLHEAVTRDRINSANSPDDNSYEALKDRIEDLARDADRLVKEGAATDQTAADRASDLANRLGELQKTADAARAEEKRPHDEAGRAVQIKWKPVIDRAGIYRDLKAQVIGPFLIAETKKRQQEEAAARKAAEEAAKAAGQPMPDVSAPRAAPKAGSGGRRSVALRTVKVVTIIDRDAALAFFQDYDQVTELIQKLAEKVTAAGVTVPGVTVSEEQRAA